MGSDTTGSSALASGTGAGTMDSSPEEELYEHHRIVCDPKQWLIQLDKFL